MERADSSNGSYHLGRWVAREDWPVWCSWRRSSPPPPSPIPPCPTSSPPTTTSAARRTVRRQGHPDGDPAPGHAGDVRPAPWPAPDRPPAVSYPRFRSTFRVIRAGLVVFFGLLTLVTLAAAKGIGLPMGPPSSCCSAMFILLGNYMGRSSPTGSSASARRGRSPTPRCGGAPTAGAAAPSSWPAWRVDQRPVRDGDRLRHLPGGHARRLCLQHRHFVRLLAAGADLAPGRR